MARKRKGNTRAGAEGVPGLGQEKGKQGAVFINNGYKESLQKGIQKPYTGIRFLAIKNSQIWKKAMKHITLALLLAGCQLPTEPKPDTVRHEKTCGNWHYLALTRY